MDALAVLISGGLDSAILLGDALRRHSVVHPVYVRCGLFWESTELVYLDRYLQALRSPALQPLTILDQPTRDLYGSHWSITGKNVPGTNSPDEAVFLPGRNMLLLAKSLLWCHLHEVPNLALGSLGTNPFPDASTTFFQGMENLANQSVHGRVRICLPFAGMEKNAVMHLGKGLPLQYSFSCIKPNQERHCGQCNKCAERRHAFANAAMIDASDYASP